MGSLKADEEVKKELDDSGYVQDDPTKSSESGKHVQLLDLSDDELLCILSHCGPSELKALGFTCVRLAGLIRDRTLWQRVDARDTPYGRRRLRWLLAHALHAGTTQLMLKGFAKECAGCQGHVNRLRKDVEAIADKNNAGGSTQQQPSRTWPRTDYQFHPLPRPSVSPSWPEDDPLPLAGKADTPPETCRGPQFTLTPCLLRQITLQCNLTHLALEYCNINCNTTSLANFPPRLCYLSLRGAKCFNMPLDKSFLFKIQDHLPNLEHLDLSECSWLDPSCLLPLSKLLSLRKLYMSSCPRMTEFVAYASLAARYGFRKLQVFDLRGSPVGDSEAAGLGWLPELEELYLSAACPAGNRTATSHHHYRDDVLAKPKELADWEIQEPEYFKNILKQYKHKRSKEIKVEKCYHNLPFNHCMDGFGEQITKKTRNLKRKKNPEDPGPSKRKKSSADSSSSESDDEDMNDEEGDFKNSETNGKQVNEDVNGETNEGNGEGVEGNGEEANAEEINNGENAAVNNEEAINNEDNAQANGENRNIEVRPRAHVIFVNVGHQLHPVYRLALPNEPGANEFRRHPIENQIPLWPVPFPNHQSPSNHNLITDSAIRSFGHSDDNYIDYFHIGGPPNGPQNSGRPNKSNLRILSVVGYRNITDKSLLHLCSSAPKLKVLDFSQTSVTWKGVDTFKARRPDVEVKFSPFVDPDAIDYRVQGE